MFRESLESLADADPDRRLFGAFSHGYRLNPPVGEATLARAESAIGGPLPAEYRDFLVAVGDGGAGPYYGLHPLGTALDRLENALGSLATLGRDCPLTSDVDFGEMAGQPDDWDEHVARLDADPAYAGRFDELADTYTGDPWLDGRLPIVDYGCGTWFFLAVRGPRRGTVWADCTDDSTGLYCLNVDFLTFYRRWLDDATARAAVGEPYSRNAVCAFLEYGDNPRYQPVE